ncbi:MAG TPA: glucan biosynthesis protein, partial [Tepidisphaeraceae bacterium]|nr:glucan biosynthesis protein [Tepidisphaeraceae bacterium]
MNNTLVRAGMVLWLALPLGSGAFGFEEVRARAQALAAQPFHAPADRLPEALARMSYVEHRAIQFKHQKALWKEERLPFQIEFFHPGYFHKQTVTIHEIDSQTVRTIPFNPDFFDYGTNRLQLPSDFGYAGFRV